MRKRENSQGINPTLQAYEDLIFLENLLGNY